MSDEPKRERDEPRIEPKEEPEQPTPVFGPDILTYAGENPETDAQFRQGPLVHIEPADDGTGPPPEDAPVLSGIEPASLPVSDPDTEATITGTGFTESSVIVWNGGDEVTTFIDAEHLSTLVKPSTVQADPLPFTLKVAVRNGSAPSNELDFTFTE